MKKNKTSIPIAVVLLSLPLVLLPDPSSADGTEDLVVPKGSVLGIVDGIKGVGEYLTTKNLSNGLGSFDVRTYRSADGSIEEIQLFFSINDSSQQSGDEIRIYFDADHDHSPDLSIDRGIQIKRQPTDVNRTQVNLFAAPSELGDLPAARWSINPSTGPTWEAEVKIRAGDLNLNFVPSLMGMHVKVFDQTAAGPTNTGNYPTTVNVNQIASWANFKTRHPLEYVVLLDQSGSMEEDLNGNYGSPVADHKWTAVKKATDVLAQIYYAFRPVEVSGTPYFSDKIGLATYEWSGGTDQSEVVKSLQLLKDITVDGYTDSSPAPDPPGARTPIKRGLDKAFSMFSAGSDFEKVVLLMSDGLHNEPTSTYSDDLPYVFPTGTDASHYQVNTVALGQGDGAVDTGLLDDIRDDFAAGGFGGAFNTAGEEAALENSFVENLFSHLYLNRVTVNGSGEFLVNENEPRLLVMLIWNSAGVTDRGFRLKRPDDTIIDTGYHHFKNTTLDYEIAYYLVDEPSPTGTWQTISTTTLSAEVGDNTFALFDPTVYAFFSAVESGDSFTLKAVLKENGQPITGPGATVVVDVSKPEEGLGTYASTAQRDCTFTPPVFDPATASAQPATATGQGEALPPLFAKVRELLGFCDKEGLERSHLSGLPLYDDGTHGDELAGDGIHTLRFEDTWREGTYTFAFEASGSAPSGSSFSRQRTLSIHRSVDVVAETTELNFVELPRPGGGRLLVYYIIPRGSEGQYLGPGHVDQIDFLTADGDWLTAMIDHQNGVYSRMLGLEAGQRRPVVTAVAQGKPLGEVGRFQGIPDELVLPFAGGFFFDDSLGIDDDVVFGAKLGYHLTPRVTLELEGGITSTETEAGTSVDLLQALANFRFHFRRWDGGRSDPYLTGGTGIVFFRSALGNDDAIAIQGGVGTIYHFSNSLGLQLEARVLRLEGLLDVEATTNYQATAGLVFTLK